MPPNQIGKYQVTELLGSGAMGVVYKCRQPDLDRFVAVKVLSTLGEGEGLLRFRREARAAAQIAHPNVLQIHDFGIDNDRPFLVMEWVDGRPLDQLMGDPVLTVDGALQVTFHVAQALHAAHLCNVVHRDVKPSNILIDSAGRPKLADFGLAKLLDNAPALSHSGDLIGTPRYMSPEQVLLGTEEIDARCDVYSLSAVLYEMLTGRPPFDGPNAMSIIRQITDEDPISPSAIKPEIPAEVSELCMKALSKDRDDRYQTAEEFAHAIQAYVTNRWFGKPDVELLAGLPPLPRPQPRRWPWRLAVVLLTAGAVTGGMAARTFFSNVGPNRGSEDSSRTAPIDVLKSLTEINHRLEGLPTATDPAVHRERLKSIFADLATLRVSSASSDEVVLASARAHRRAGDYLGSLDALADWTGTAKSQAAVVERVLANYQHFGLTLGNLDDPLLHPKPPRGMAEDVEELKASEPYRSVAELAFRLTSGDIEGARKMAEGPVLLVTDPLLKSDWAMLRADALLRAAELAYSLETMSEKGRDRDAAAKTRESTADLSISLLRIGLDADPNHIGLNFLKANSYHQPSLWERTINDSPTELARRHRTQFAAAQNRIRAATPVRGADFAVGRMVLFANCGRPEKASDQLDDALALRSGTESLLVYQAWLRLLNPTDGELTADEALGVVRDISRAYDPPSEGAPAYVRALANAAAGKWDDCQADVRLAVKLWGRKLPPKLSAIAKLWLHHADRSSIGFLHMTLDVLWQMPTPAALRIEAGKEVLRRAANEKLAVSEGIGAKQLSVVRAFTNFRLAKFHVERSEKDYVLKYLRAALAEKVDDLSSETCREDTELGSFNADPDFIKLYAEFPNS